MSPVGFEHTIWAGERPKTYTLDREATGTDFRYRTTANTSNTYTRCSDLLVRSLELRSAFP
jgi:hypothetical protein